MRTGKITTRQVANIGKDATSVDVISLIERLERQVQQGVIAEDDVNDDGMF